MSVYESSVKRPVLVSIAFIAVMILGIFSYSKLSIDLLPEFDMNMAIAIVTYPNASAEDVENYVTKTLEATLSTVNNLKKVTSTSKDNVALVTVEFNWGTDLDDAVNDMRDKLELVKMALPDGCSSPMIFKLSTSMMPVVIYSVDAKESMSALYKILDDNMSNPLQRIEGVGSVTIAGAPQREIVALVDPQKMEAYNLTVESIGGRIAAENLNMPSGKFYIGNESYTLRIEGEYKESEPLNDIVVTNYGGPIYLKDVATIRDSLQEKVQESYVNGKRGATVVVSKQNGANSVDVVNKINKALPSIKKNLPPDVHITEIMNSTDNIINSINSLKETILLAFVFVIVVIMYFLGQWRAALIVIITIPVSLIGAFIYLFATGNTLNMISMSALTIAIGMVVDDAIVVMENVTKHIERGAAPREAAIYGTNEVATAVIATTLTLIAVFFPFTMLGGMAGIMFKQLGWMMCIIMVVSTTCALTLTPMLCSIIYKRKQKSKGQIAAPKANVITKIRDIIQRQLDVLDNAYEKLLSWCVSHKPSTIIISFAVFFVSLLLIKFIGTDFIPRSDNAQISGSIELPAGASVERSKVIAERFYKYARENFPELKNMTYTVGTPSDDEDNSFALMQTSGDNYISFRMKFIDIADRKRDIYEMSDLMREELASYPEVAKSQVTPGGQQGGMTGGSTVEVHIYGFDFETTTKLANQYKEKMSKIDGLKDITISRKDYTPQFNLEFDREKLAENGLSVSSASTFVRNRMNGMTASLFREDGDEYKIKVRYAEEFRKNIEDIENITLYSSAGKPIKLSEVAKVVEKFAPPQIERQDRERIVKVTATLSGTTIDKAKLAIDNITNELSIPSNIGIEIGGSIEDQQDTFSDMGILMILIIILVYSVMAGQFESFRSPFIIMLSVPFALTGMFLGLWITGGTLNMMSAIGAIMLVGIVVKNGIVLVDYINLNRERGMSIVTSIVSGGKSRLRPVLMTTATTVLGMLPMAIGIGEGSEVWQPMGIVIVFGLTVSTLVTLVLIPTIYGSFAARKMNRERKNFKRKLRKENI
ncbi:MAG: efflux RND transporter permease subunit [Bacteroidales bacterium]|nr:efflux RND transporter permease subunit [Bacteroidales bacterium]